jgi:hypothetical protein
MPTQIIDGFKLNAITPIDTRMITTGTASRDAMPYKYVGLRVFDTTQKLPFVFVDGVWKEESTVTSNQNISGTKPNYVPKFTATGMTNSAIREQVIGQNKYVGINITDSVTLNSALQVGGTVCATNFCGTINGTNLTNNTVELSKIKNPNQSGTFVLKSINNTLVWGTEGGGGGGGGSATTQLDTQSTASFLTFANSSSSTSFLVSCRDGNTFIGADLSSSQLTLSNTNNHTAPAYSFIGSKNTGFYGNITEVGMSLAGNRRIYANSSSTKILVGSTLTIDTSTTCVGLKKDTTVDGTLTSTGIISNGTMTIDGTFQVCQNNAAAFGGTLVVSDTTTLVATCVTDTMCVTAYSYFNTNSAVTAEVRNTNATGCALVVRHCGQGLLLKQHTASTTQENKIVFTTNSDTTRGFVGYESGKEYITIGNGTDNGYTRFYSNTMGLRMKTRRLQVNNSMVFAGIYTFSTDIFVGTLVSGVPTYKMELHATSENFYLPANNSGFTTGTKWEFTYVSSITGGRKYRVTHRFGDTNYTPIVSPRWDSTSSVQVNTFNGYISVSNIANESFDIHVYGVAGETLQVDVLVMHHTSETNYDFY